MKIGIIGPKDSVENIANKLSKIDKNIEYRFYIREEVARVSEVFDKYEEEVDGIILTGEGIHQKFLTYGNPKKPYTYIKRTAINLMATLWRVKNDLGKISTFSVDVLTEEYLEDALEELGLPRTSVELMPFSPTHAEEDYLNWHKELYTSGKVDTILTSFGSIYNRLKKEGYPVYRLYPTYSQVKVAYKELLYKSHISKLKSSQIAVQIIKLPKGENKNYYEELERKNRIENNIISYVRSTQGALYSTGRDEYIISGTRGAFETNLSDFFKLFLQTGKTLNSGIGYGDTAYQADINAKIALTASLEQGELFIVDEKGIFIGPLTSENSENKTQINKVQNISNKTGLSPAYISKIIELLDKKNNALLDTQELAGYLNISDRSARRILSKLEEHGYGEVEEKTNHLKGRPKKIIKIKF